MLFVFERGVLANDCLLMFCVVADGFDHFRQVLL